MITGSQHRLSPMAGRFDGTRADEPSELILEASELGAEIAAESPEHDLLLLESSSPLRSIILNGLVHPQPRRTPQPLAHAQHARTQTLHPTPSPGLVLRGQIRFLKADALIQMRNCTLVRWLGDGPAHRNGSALLVSAGHADLSGAVTSYSVAPLCLQLQIPMELPQTLYLGDCHRPFVHWPPPWCTRSLWRGRRCLTLNLLSECCNTWGRCPCPRRAAQCSLERVGAQRCPRCRRRDLSRWRVRAYCEPDVTSIQQRTRWE